MEINKHIDWLQDFYEERGWYKLSSEIRMNFLIEEVGELSRAIRAIELGRHHPGEATLTEVDKMDNLKEELSDVMDQVFIICRKYDLNPEDLFTYGENKINKRWHRDEGENHV
ncbi:hypothetical protein GSH19_00105 [Lactobacillus sp. S2-2]|uniref:MazG-like family protein n=1 Tax=Lactobacillus sp. S2-2 TaxID=2692917 RepID=UPI001F258059|nr:MazG-like family protein [Lactobacillus sp. S2-2]MCF6514588.1 hypothetical protein [Lactobacillus sp. S2-2]